MCYALTTNLLAVLLLFRNLLPHWLLSKKVCVSLLQIFFYILVCANIFFIKKKLLSAIWKYGTVLTNGVSPFSISIFLSKLPLSVVFPPQFDVPMLIILHEPLLVVVEFPQQDILDQLGYPVSYSRIQ